MNKILLIGASGFIGKRVYQLLKNIEVDLYLSTRDKNKYANTVPANKLITFDLSSPKSLSEIDLSVYDIVINCSGELHKKSIMQAVHVDSIRLMLSKVKRDSHWIQLSSCGVYGSPTNETVIEKNEFKPEGVYEITKADSDSYISNYCYKKDIRYTIFRPSIVIARDMPNSSVRRLIHAIKSKKFICFTDPKKVILNYVSADNVAEAIVAAVSSNNFVNEDFILNQPIKLSNFFSLVIQSSKLKAYHFRLPKFMGNLIANTLGRLNILPLTPSRLKTLTSSTCYSSEKLLQKTDFIYNNQLAEVINQIMESMASE